MPARIPGRWVDHTALTDSNAYLQTQISMNVAEGCFVCETQERMCTRIPEGTLQPPLMHALGNNRNLTKQISLFGSVLER